MLKALNFYNLDISRNFFLGIDFLFKRWIPCQTSTSVLYLHYGPETVLAVQKMHLWNNFPCILTLQTPITTSLIILKYNTNCGKCSLIINKIYNLKFELEMRSHSHFSNVRIVWCLPINVLILFLAVFKTFKILKILNYFKFSQSFSFFHLCF